jgi:hypothetical protein
MSSYLSKNVYGADFLQRQWNSNARNWKLVCYYFYSTILNSNPFKTIQNNWNPLNKRVNTNTIYVKNVPDEFCFIMNEEKNYRVYGLCYCVLVWCEGFFHFNMKKEWFFILNYFFMWTKVNCSIINCSVLKNIWKINCKNKLN